MKIDKGTLWNILEKYDTKEYEALCDGLSNIIREKYHLKDASPLGGAEAATSRARPERKEGASALLTFLATVIEPHAETEELALPAIEEVRSVLLL